MSERPRCIGDRKKNKTRFGAVWRNPWGDFPQFCANVHCVPRVPTPQIRSRDFWRYINLRVRIPGFIKIRSGLGEL